MPEQAVPKCSPWDADSGSSQQLPSETGEACESELFDVVVIGQILSAKEKTLLIHRIKTDFHLPVVLITGGRVPNCRADAYVRSDAPAEDLFQAITQLTAESAGPVHAVDIVAG